MNNLVSEVNEILHSKPPHTTKTSNQSQSQNKLEKVHKITSPNKKLSDDKIIRISSDIINKSSTTTTAASKKFISPKPVSNMSLFTNSLIKSNENSSIHQTRTFSV